MEHEVFVPFPVDTVRQALSEPDRIARCVPGLQQDADEDAGPLAGRLRLRIGGSTITYRGSLRLTERGGGVEVEGEGTEARGGGSVKLALTLTPRAVEGGGTGLLCSGTVRSEGRLAEFDAHATETVARRLLDRFGSALASGLEAAPISPPAEHDPLTEADLPLRAEDAARTEAAEEAEDVDVDDIGDLDDVDQVEDVGALAELGGLDEDEPPAEAAHARRTMIGRSTEEVDHAPPRGRYAPVPAPEAGSTGATLRWAAPAAAVVIASAVVVGRRVLRRRR
ncbi:SRPBCC domain-containing protein [Streptomyces botrytidirepellens]|uniref:Carbon monoxide dehydrogenase subunit G n=1 Tax=Streptomyces botrytidirepellens TaxID=2486417 RepID=A0A3M8VYS2_9ACTN|nr:SRPBCC domain-containing protein [Streptomyces botrytidirepellens]RNG22287.1 carbon monoxide dehydrogenase subunit G [Streptomyces botrytidirepellens]